MFASLLGKSWDEIIPECERQKLDDEELHQQLVALNPPPRSRKTVSKSVSSFILSGHKLVIQFSSVQRFVIHFYSVSAEHN